MSMQDRESAFENKYANDLELKFKIESRAAKNVALWAAEQLGRTGDEAKALADSIIGLKLANGGFQGVVQEVKNRIQKDGAAVSDHAIDTIAVKKLEEAEEALNG